MGEQGDAIPYQGDIVLFQSQPADQDRKPCRDPRYPASWPWQTLCSPRPSPSSSLPECPSHAR
jgi:hypothetical protein